MNIDIEDEGREKKFLWISRNDTISVSGIFFIFCCDAFAKYK